MVETVRRKMGSGFLAVVVSSLFFATSGTFGKGLIQAGWSPALVVTVRVGGAALLLLPWTLTALRGRWRELGPHLRAVALYGFLGIAAAQLGYFGAVEHLDVGVALLIEYLGTVLVVLWVWARTRRTPHRFTLLGVLFAVSGLVCVLDLAGAAPPNLTGVAWGLFAATGMAGHYIIAGRPTPVPAVAFAGLGLVGGTILLALSGAIGLVPMAVGADEVVLAGRALPAWAAFAELVLVAAAAAYLLGIIGARRLGATLASFVGLSEVLFAILIAWLLLAEVPGPLQVVGGVLILAGVIAVRVGELRDATPDPLTDREPETVHAP